MLPSVSIDWYRAQVACLNSGKELLPNAIWQAAASGTPDMSGNVWEWVAEWGSYTPTANGVWPAGPGTGEDLYGNGSTTIGASLRGGGWAIGAYAGVFAFNAYNGPSGVSNAVGFRCGRRR